MDLTKSFPRSPFAKLEEMIWIPRLIDKARAKIDGKLGEYVYDCPMDQRALQFLGVSAEAFLEAVRSAADDGAVLAWIKANTSQKSGPAIEEFNLMLASLGPTSTESQKKFAATRDKIAPGKEKIRTWAGLIDLEEGRIK